MSMSTHAIGFVQPDEKWDKMKRVWTACQSAGVDPPDEVREFFNYQDPDPMGVEVEIPYEGWQNHAHGMQGIQVAVKDIPERVTHIRFYNSW